MNRNFVSDARKAARITQAEMAEYLGMIQSTYSSKEQSNRFTALELSKIEKKIGTRLFNEAKMLGPSHTLNEPPHEYGNAGADYREILKAVNELLGLHRTGIIIQAEIYAALKNKPVMSALSDIKDIYKEKTGKELDI